MFGHWRRHRKERIEQSLRAIAKAERLSDYIDYQRLEAAGLKKWAHECLEANHLTQLFETGRKR